ncbi:MAG: hypothetical protein AB7R40_24210 [Nitrospiraceae bacterium]
MSISARVVFLFVGTLALTAQAQGILYVRHFETQALFYSQQGVVSGCGVRLMGVAEDLNQVVDASVNISNREGRLFGVLKFLSYDLAMRQGEPNLRPVAVSSGWLRPREGDPVVPATEAAKGDDQVSVIYGLNAEDAADLLLAAAQRQHFLVAVTREVSNFERVYSGPVQMSKRDHDEIGGCLDELLR